MKRIHKIIAGTAGALTLVAAASLAFAHGGGYGPGSGSGSGGCEGPGVAGGGHMGMMYGGMGPGMGPGMGQGGMRGGMGFGMMSETSLAQLKTDLAITTEQEPAWQAFAGKVAEQSAQMQALHQQQRSGDTPTTAPAQMSLRIGHMTQRLAGMQAMNTALTDLYAVLTPEQRKLADQYMGRPGGRGPGHGPGYNRGQRG